MKYIELTRGKQAIVDDEDLEKVCNINWTAQETNYCGSNRFVASNNRFGKLYMHRLIMGQPKEMYVDHINGDGLDNRKENLRVCTVKENSKNRQTMARNNTS